MLIAFNKPFGVLSQFTSDNARPTLADFIDVPNVYAAGRLDHDSEGLLLLTDDGALQHAIANPAKRLVKRYWAEIEGVPTAEALARFSAGLTIGEGADRYRAAAASAQQIDEPTIWARTPAVRFRAKIPTSWLEVALEEGRNRQVRRMTAAIGHPTLRLIRVGIGALDLLQLGIAPGVWIAVEADRLGIASGKRKVRAASGDNPERPLSTGFRNRRYWE